MRLILTFLISCAILIGSPLCLAPAEAQLRGHGGPIRALAISTDGATALSGSFDTSAIRWSLRRNTAEQVLRFHEGALNAVAILTDGRAVTAGEDAVSPSGRRTSRSPTLSLKDTRGRSLHSVSSDGATLASASWDRTIRLWPLAGGAPQVLDGHQQSVNGVAFTPDGKAVVSVGYDATVHIWPLYGRGSPLVAPLPSPLNAVVAATDGEIIAAGADGKVYFLAPAGEPLYAVEASSTPITPLATSHNGERVAAASIGGSVVIIDRRTRALTRKLLGSGRPVWSVVFFPDNRTLLTGGADRMIGRWDSATGKPIGTIAIGGSGDPLAGYAGNPGAQVFRACVACHTLKPDQGNRAGPTLHGILGRRIATLAGYNFSEALKRLDIVWTPETEAKLFEIGPARYTPGTKMPEQRIGSPEDRNALVQFLERATK